MSALEQEIIDRFRLLSEESRIELLYVLQQEVETHQLTLSEWLADVNRVSISLKTSADATEYQSSDLLNEVREERDAEILHSIGFGNTTSDSTK